MSEFFVSLIAFDNTTERMVACYDIPVKFFPKLLRMLDLHSFEEIGGDFPVTLDLVRDISTQFQLSVDSSLINKNNEWFIEVTIDYASNGQFPRPDKHPYEKFQSSELWKIVENAIDTLEKNQDVVLCTRRVNVVGYLVEQIIANCQQDGQINQQETP